MTLRAVLALATLLVSSAAAAQSPGSAPVDSTSAGTIAHAAQAPADNNPAPGPVPVTPTPPDFPRGKISGYLFGDTYYNAAGDPTHVYSASGADAGQTNIDAVKPITRDLDGIQVRRVYLQLDNDLSIRYATRVRLEMDGKALTSDGKIGAFVKNAYFQAKSVIPRGDFFFGMMNTPTWDNAEEFWQYRALEKTIGDFRGIGAASDLGLELKGNFDPDHHVGYVLMVGDGTGQKPENDRFKKVYLSLPIRQGNLRFEPYVDYQAVRVNLQPKLPADTDSLAVNADQATYKIFAGYEFPRLAIGAEGIVRVNHGGPAANREPRGASLYARATVSPVLTAVARVDQWQTDAHAAQRVDSRLWIAALDWQPAKEVHVMPNIEETQYLSRGGAVAPAHHDLQVRITFFVKFSRPQS